jgi:uncharacterized surface protein with fasciclin (FAS1) repeats
VNESINTKEVEEMKRRFGLAVYATLAVLLVGPAGSYAADKDIVDTAIAAGKFNTLATALTEAGLVSTLKGPGPFTVFAPTDEAFAKLPPGTLEALLKDKAKLTEVLTYHVVSGRMTATDVAKLQEATTVQGGQIRIDTTGGVTVNDARVITTDVMASNGVIHVIDRVILPN